MSVRGYESPLEQVDRPCAVVVLIEISAAVESPAPAGETADRVEAPRLDLGSGWEHRALKSQHLVAWQLVGERP